MTEHSSPIKPPTAAGPARRALHTLLALGGWALFLYWWWLVVHRVSRQEVRFTLLFIAVSLVVIVATTALWAWHNRRIFERKGPRLAVRDVTPDFSHDRVGRPVTFEGDARSAPVVIVRLTPRGKTYEPYAGMSPRAARAAGERGGGMR